MTLPLLYVFLISLKFIGFITASWWLIIMWPLGVVMVILAIFYIFFNSIKHEKL